MKIYSVWLHWKQGDEMADCLENSKTVPEALLKKAQMAQFVADRCTDLAKLFEGKDIECDADTHHIGFTGDEKILTQAVKMELLSVEEFEDEDEDYIECSFCGEPLTEDDLEESENCLFHNSCLDPDWDCDDGK